MNKRPNWTLLYNVSISPESWVGTGWEFFNDPRAAQARYEHLNSLWWPAVYVPTLRPYHHATDSKHLGAVHRMKATP